MANYSKEAHSAALEGLAPLSIEETASVWQLLGVSRQTAWNWRKGLRECPLPARMAAAWHAKNRPANNDPEFIEQHSGAILRAVAVTTDADKLRRVAEIVGYEE